MTRARDIADQQKNLGGAVPPFTAGKNLLINGGMDLWQRGTTFTASNAAVYTADRWQTVASGTANITVSRQVTGDTTNLPNIQYCSRVQRTAANTSTFFVQLAQSIETVNSIPFVGKTVTLSYYARAGANYSSASNALNVLLISGTGTDQNVLLTPFSGSTNLVNSSGTLTTTWQRFTYTATVPTTATQLGLDIYYTPTGTAGANDYFEVTGVQLEVGSAATPFSRNASTIQGELAACQRYYYRNTGTSLFSYFAGGSALSTTAASVLLTLPVQMRVKPTSLDSGNVRLSDLVSGFTIGSLTLSTDGNSPNVVTLDATGASGLTQFRPLYLGANNNTAGYVGVSAEL